jgi:hypothetical protein
MVIQADQEGHGDDREEQYRGCDGHESGAPRVLSLAAPHQFSPGSRNVDGYVVRRSERDGEAALDLRGGH